MKVGIVGSGLVGATAAYAMVMRGVGREVVLVDIDQERAQAEADDILHAVPFAHPLNVRAGNYSDLQDSKVVVLSAGAAQRPGESRPELLDRNAAIFRDILPQIFAEAPEAIMLVATNPVDALTHLTARYAVDQGIPAQHVVGSGTTLDTARFRALLGQRLGIDAHHIHAYVVGEHGDSEVLTWSLVTIGGTPLDEFCLLHQFNFTTAQQREVDERVRRAADHIISGKGATYYGIGSALARIVDVILRNQRAIMTVCAPVEEIAGVEDVTVSLPRLVGGQGVLDRFPLPLNDQELDDLRRSALIVRQSIERLENIHGS